MKPRRDGQILIELMLGTAMVGLIVASMVVAIAGQTRVTASMAGRARARLVLEGELECMRGAADVAACDDESFMPRLLADRDGFPGVTFRRTVVRRDAEGLVDVVLAAESPTFRRTVRVEGVLRLAEEGAP